MKKISSYDLISIAHQAWPKILNEYKKNKRNINFGMQPIAIGARIKKNNSHYDKTECRWIMIKGRGCWHHKRGGCTICSYRFRDEGLPEENISKMLKEGIAHLVDVNRDQKEKIFGIATGGSFFDEVEVPLKERKLVYDKLRKISEKGEKIKLIVESRLEFLTDEIFEEAREALGPNVRLIIGYGLESTNPVIREAILNKMLPPDWVEKTNLVKRNGGGLFANILFKPPFLTEEEAINDVVRSVRETYKLRLAKSIVIMVMSVAKGTIVEYLYSKERYELPSIWSVVRIIKELGPEVCEITSFNGLAWTTDQYDKQKKGQAENGLVTGCEECNSVLLPKLLNFKAPNLKKEWEDLINSAETLNCRCKKEYNNRHEEKYNISLNERVYSEIDKLSHEILGKRISEY